MSHIYVKVLEIQIPAVNSYYLLERNHMMVSGAGEAYLSIGFQFGSM